MQLDEEKSLMMKVVNAMPFIKDELDMRFTYHSNHIENNTVTYSETITIIKDGLGVVKPLKDILDIENHHEAVKYLHILVDEDRILNLKIIRKLYVLVVPKIQKHINPQTGFRFDSVEIQGTDLKISKSYGIAHRLEKIIDEYNHSTAPFFERLALFHIEFEKIHPFPEGNGLTGRLLMNFELMKNGFPLTAIEDVNKISYLDVFNHQNAVKEMTNIIKLSVENTFEFIKKKQIEYSKKSFKTTYNDLKDKLHKADDMSQGLKIK